VAISELIRAHVDPDVGAVHELDPLLLENRHPPVDDPLLELGVRDPEAHQASRTLVALVHGHDVAAVVQLGRDRHAGRAGADHRHALAGPPLRRRRHDPTLVECPLDDRELDLLDRHGVVVDCEHAS
jgi:hypothetical protein